MAKMVLTDASATINVVDLSAWVRSITIDYGAEIVENTTMASTTKTKLAGVKDWSVSIEFTQDYAAAAVDKTLFALVGAAPFAVIFKPTSAAVSATNPSYTGNALLESNPPMSGSHGAGHVVSVTLQGTDTLTRNES